MQPSENPLSTENKKWIVGIALLQGLLLYALQASAVVESWSPVLRYLCYTLVIALPPLIIVSLGEGNSRWFYRIFAGFALLLAALAAYRGYQCTPASANLCEFPRSYIASLAVATFILAFFLRACTTGDKPLRKPEYSALFHFSWDNALTIGLMLIFVGIFWLILQLWAALFHLVGVDFFRTLFRQDWFLYPVSWFVGGAGIVLFRSQQSFVLTLKRLLRTMLVALLPLLAILVVIFLATLPFTGLQPIWDTGHGSVLMLWLVALLLFFTNGVIQDEFPFSRYPRWLNWLLLLALVLAPLYAAIALYGLSLRVIQHGWTPDRLWGITVAITLALLALSYCVAILRRGEHWASSLRAINTGLAFWVLGICLVTQSPLADFWKISAQDQLARLQAGKVDPQDFDFYFMRRELGRPGYTGLQYLREQPVIKQDQALATYVDKLLQSEKVDWDLRQNPRRQAQRQQSLTELEIFPAGKQFPQSLLETNIQNHICQGEKPDCFWLAEDLDGDGADELLLFALTGKWLHVSAYSQIDGEWQLVGENGAQTPLSFSELHGRVAAGDYQLKPSRWQSLYTGDNTLLFDPSK